MNRRLDRVEIIDGQGKTLLPSFVDLHAHFRDPGQTQKEDIASGSRAAAHGGYTAVNLMANTVPVCSDMETVREVLQKAEDAGLVTVHQVVSATKDFDGATTDHLDNIDTNVVRWISEDGHGISDTGVMLCVMQICKEKGIGVMLHEQVAAISTENTYLSEEIMTHRDVSLAQFTHCRLHFCHVSTIDSMDAIIGGKRYGANITCEVTPHHLYFNDSTAYRVAPPLRGESHRQYLIQCIKDGHVDAIATDHAPHTQADKDGGANGITGLDLAFSTCYTALVQAGHITLSELSRLLSENPAKILGIEGGVIAEGEPANLVLVDTGASFTVTPEHIHSRSKNTPLIGETLYGEVIFTMRSGSITYEKAN